MKPALCLLAALPLMAQPKLLVNAKVDTRSASAGLEREFQALVKTQPQPAWVGWEVPAVRGSDMSCEYVRDGYSTAGIVHLEPPDHAIILFRVDGSKVEKLRTISPNCEIDVGDLPFHWLTDASPAQSVALLATYVQHSPDEMSGALTAIAAHADPSADPVLDRYLAAGQPDWLRRRVATLEGSQRGRHGVDVLKSILSSDLSESVKQGALSGLARNKDPEALDLLISTARNGRDPRTRAQAISALNRKPGEKVLDTINDAIAHDTDLSVRRRAVDTLGSLPEGVGIPSLIQLVKTSKDMDVRKAAMNKLQNSRDPRAEAFFEEVLK